MFTRKRLDEAGVRLYHTTPCGRMLHGDSASVLNGLLAPESVDLIVTSPPFALTRTKEYGNEVGDAYYEWFRTFAEGARRVLKDTGSFVIDLGGAWNPGQPTRSLYQFKLLIMLCEEYGFHLAQDFYWWNPARLPAPAEWVNVRRIRVKDSVNTVWWLSKTPWPRASNRRVVQPYSESMKSMMKTGYRAKLRPSGHDIGEGFGKDNGGSIPPNLIALAHTESNSTYLRYCADKGIKPHPARFPVELPEYFIRMLTDEDDLVVDIFGGSCATGEACERLKRRWICCDQSADYLQGAMGRFQEPPRPRSKKDPDAAGSSYKIHRPDVLWNGASSDSLADNGGIRRPPKEPKLQKVVLRVVPPTAHPLMEGHDAR
jgi:site-specific DNA-methyltransferase (cytosine-N4-specific)